MTTEPAVVDTNVVVSGLLTSTAASPTARVLDGMLSGSFRFLLSVDLLAEYRVVLLRPKIRRRHRLSAAEIDILLTDIAANGVLLETGSSGDAVKSDDHLRRMLDAAPSALLVTGDRRLAERLRGRARVASPRAFVERRGE